MIIRKNILKTIVTVFLIVVIFATLYINKFLAPTWLKGFLIKSVSQAVDRPVSLASVRLNPLRGFIIEGLTLYEPDGKTEFLRIERLTTSILLIPLINEHKILIPSVRIFKPSVRIVKKADNSWNFAAPPLLKKAQPASDDTKGFTLLIQNIAIENGRIDFTDNTRAPAYNKALIGLDATAVYSAKENAVRFKAASKVTEPLKTSIGLEGAYLIKENSLITKTVIKNLPILELYNYFYKLSLIANLKSGDANAVIDIKTETGKKIGISYDASIKNLDISYYDLNLKGDLGLAGTSNLDFAEIFKQEHKAAFNLKGSTLKGLYFFNEISDVTGTIEISKDGISTAGLEGIAHNVPIKFIGGIKNMDDPQFRGSLHIAKTDLAGLKSFLPEDLRTKFDRINIAGSGEGEIKVYKRFKEPTPLAVSGRIKIKGASFNSPDMPEGPEKIMGDVIFENEAIYFSRASFVYGKKSYLVDAKIEDFKTPDIKMRLESKDFLIDARLKLFPESIHILRASGNYLNSPFNISGTVSDIKNAQVSLKGNIKLDLVNLRTLLPGISEPLTRFGIKGICDLEFDLKGPWKEFRNWDAVVKGKSERINIWDLKFDSVKLDLRIKQNALLLNELSAKPYGGALFSNMEIDLTQPNPPYTANLVLDGVDLNKLIADTDLKGRTMSGTAALKTTLRGYGKNTDTMKGEGSVLIKGSYLWEMPLLKGLGDLLFLPNLSSIVFEEVSGNFIITNKTITTSNLGFHSKGISLLAEGGVNFDGNLDLMVTTSVSEDFVKDTSEFQRLAGLLFAQAGQFLGNIKINGTIKKPEYKFVPFALDKVLPDKFKDLLGGFF